LVYLLYVQTTVLLDARRSARELDAQRGLADQAEASRFTELRAVLEERMQKIESLVKEEQSLTAGRLAEHERSLRSSVEEGTRTLAAFMGELGDRLDRGLKSGAGSGNG
jgi:hypothetical protein